MPPLQIYDRRERTLVRLADVVLAPLAWRRRPRPSNVAVRRVLLLRLERIGDLLMTLDAIAQARAAWPDADVDLAVASWNEPLARLIPGVSQLHIVDVPWLARGAAGDSWATLVRKARAWRARRYDLAINFEPDLRSNLLAWFSASKWRLGYGSGGGGALLTHAWPYDLALHVSDNAGILVSRAAALVSASPARPGAPGAASAAHMPHRSPPPSSMTDTWPRLRVGADAALRAHTLLAQASGPRIGIHASGGRPSKQWHVERFAAVGRRLASERGATIVVTGSAGDRPLVDALRAQLGTCAMIDACDLDLETFAAVLGSLDVFVSSDTGPMHLAAAMGTPVVALFGPSNPRRYGPRARVERVIRVDLPCSPCGQVRLPPERCRGHVPECLDKIRIDDVVRAAAELLDGDAEARAHG